MRRVRPIKREPGENPGLSRSCVPIAAVFAVPPSALTLGRGEWGFPERGGRLRHGQHAIAARRGSIRPPRAGEKAPGGDDWRARRPAKAFSCPEPAEGCGGASRFLVPAWRAESGQGFSPRGLGGLAVVLPLAGLACGRLSVRRFIIQNKPLRQARFTGVWLVARLPLFFM